MFDPKWIREHPDLLDRGLARRGLAPAAKRLIELDEKRRAAIAKAQDLQERRNALSKEVGEAKKAKDDARAQELMADIAAIKENMSKFEEEQHGAERALDAALADIPNVPFEDVPDGKDASTNVERHRAGKPPKFDFKPKLHFEIGEALGLMDFEAAAKLSGARFVVLKGALARLERALGQLFLDVHTGENGYTEVSPPILVRNDAMFGTAQLPKFADDQFATKRSREEYEKLIEAFNAASKEAVPGTDAFHNLMTNLMAKVDETLWLIPTAEVPLTNLVRESIVEESALPMRLTACTPCFRAEAGAAGKDTRGMIRQHQFTKVELVSITAPEQSHEEHERMLASAEAVLKKLDLHYRVVTLCAGDMGFAAGKTYDIEVWLPGENTFREISSCSNCGEFQARRMQARYRPKGEKHVRYVHTLNGSGVAVGRALIAVLENYQQADGSVMVPAALQPYMNGLKRIEKAK
ncbi:MAG TPA: serine--tRNA ligase [Xanthobacteraceae bacterium]|nr:serine--tRNA ligase [Xanthobacteraceae bacterium]